MIKKTKQKTPAQNSFDSEIGSDWKSLFCLSLYLSSSEGHFMTLMNEPYINNCLILLINHDDKDTKKIEIHGKKK